MGQITKIGHLLHEAIRVYLRPYWVIHIPLGLAVVGAVGLEICLTLTVKFLIDAALIPHDLAKLNQAFLILAFLFVLVTAVRFLLGVIQAYLTFELTRDLRIALFGLMQRLPTSYYDHAKPGHFALIFDTELLTLMRVLRDLLASGLHAVLSFTVIMVTMFVLSWQLSLVILFLLPLVVARTQRRLKPTIDARDRLRVLAERVNNAVQDYVTTQPLFHAFGLRGDASKRFAEDVVGRKGGVRGTLWRYADVHKTLQTAPFLEGAFGRSINFQQTLLHVLVIGLGAFLSFTGSMTLGTFSAFILLLPRLIRAISDTADFVETLGRATLSLERFERVKQAALPESDTATHITLTTPTQTIVFDHVSFGYEKDILQIRNVNLTVPIGQSVALIGRSGAGKSTLLRLLLGFYKPTSGHVMIDGHDLAMVDPPSLGSQIGSVLQQSILANATIRDNIRFSKPEATDEEVQHAAQAAEIHDFIVRLPDGYETVVGEGGRGLSEGQRQRLSLARAILPGSAILLLDEVTSSLDPESEAAINATIERLAAERTLLLVTHRLASVTFVDRLVVVDQGVIKESGSHEDLLAQQGIYSELWRMQTGFVVSANGHYAEVGGERLQAIPLFRDVSIAKLDELAEEFVSEFYEPEQVIYEEGEAGDKFYIVVRGTVSVSTLGAEQQVIRLASLQDGDYFGEVEMLNRGKRTTTVRASTRSLLLTLQAEHFHTMMNELSSLRKIMTQMALGRSLTTICSVGRRRRNHSVWDELSGGA